MSRLPRDVKAWECIRALERAGFIQTRQSGSHVIMELDDPVLTVVVPVHRGTLSPGTLRSIIRQAGMTVAEFVALL